MHPLQYIVGEGPVDYFVRAGRNLERQALGSQLHAFLRRAQNLLRHLLEEWVCERVEVAVVVTLICPSGSHPVPRSLCTV